MSEPQNRPSRAGLAKKNAALLKKLTGKGKLDPLVAATVESNALAAATFSHMMGAASNAALKKSLLAAHSFGGVMGRIQNCIQIVTGKRPKRDEPCVKRDDAAEQLEQANAVAVRVNIEFEAEWKDSWRVTGPTVNATTVGELTGLVMLHLN